MFENLIIKSVLIDPSKLYSTSCMKIKKAKSFDRIIYGRLSLDGRELKKISVS